MVVQIDENGLLAIVCNTSEEVKAYSIFNSLRALLGSSVINTDRLVTFNDSYYLEACTPSIFSNNKVREAEASQIAYITYRVFTDLSFKSLMAAYEHIKIRNSLPKFTEVLI